MKVLGMAVMTAMSHGLGLDPKEGGELLKTMENSFWCMRLIGSFPVPGACAWSFEGVLTHRIPSVGA